MELYRSICLSHDYLTVIVRQNAELYHLTVKSSQALQTQLCSVEYLYLRAINPSGDNVSLIVRDLYLVRCDLKLEILD